MKHKFSSLWVAITIVITLTVIGCGSGGGSSSNNPTPGALDTSFNSPQGYVFYQGPSTNTDTGVEIIVQPDGKIVVAGYTTNDGLFHSTLLLRYTTSGQLDPTFGNNGTVIYNSPYDNKGLGLTLAQDGGIIVTGFIRETPNSLAGARDIMVLKFNSDGTLAQKYQYPNGGRTSIGFDVQTQADGNIVVAGEQTNPSTGTQELVVLRLHSDLSGLDTSFNGTGVVNYVGTGTGLAHGYSVTVQNDQKILVSGSETTGLPVDVNPDVLVLRYTSSGALDTAFAVNGVFIYQNPSGDYPSYGNNIELQPDGKIVVAGSIGNANEIKALLMRLNTNGTLDSTLGSNGVITYQGSGNYDYAYDIALQPDGKILIAEASGNNTVTDAAVVRFLSNGSLDTTFGTQGVFKFGVLGHDSAAYSLYRQPSDGKIVTTGYSYNNQEQALLLFRLFP